MSLALDMYMSELLDIITYGVMIYIGLGLLGAIASNNADKRNKKLEK